MPTYASSETGWVVTHSGVCAEENAWKDSIAAMVKNNFRIAVVLMVLKVRG